MQHLLKSVFFAGALLAVGYSAQAQEEQRFEMMPDEQKDGRPMMVGPMTFLDLEQFREFKLRERAEAYMPDIEKMGQLTKMLRGHTLKVFFGTWCEDSEKLIPQLFQVLQMANVPIELIPLYALDHQKKSIGADTAYATYEIEKVPTIIVLRGNDEIGRITETVDKSVEADLLKILETGTPKIKRAPKEKPKKDTAD
ncbi:MAG: hypothetical protein QM642_01180 [Edaphocola sp.]